MKNKFLNFQLKLVKNQKKYLLTKKVTNRYLRLNKLILKLNRVGLRPLKIIKVKLDELYATRNVYCEMIPVKNTKLIPFLEEYFNKENSINFSIAHIMQSQMFQKYLEGKLNKNFEELDYFKWHSYLHREGINNRPKNDIIQRIYKSLSLLENIKNKGFNDHKLINLPIITKTPIIKSRYGYHYDINGYEIYDGHHRSSALFCLKYKEIKALLVEDIADKTPFGIKINELNFK